MIIFHDPACTNYAAEGHPERPSRITWTTALLRSAHPDWTWKVPKPATSEMLLRAHSESHIVAVEKPTNDFDVDTPANRGIFLHATSGTGSAVAVAQAALRGNPAFSLMRPPGHHACRDRAMGFCYFNHIAVAALDALAQGAARVAIWDFDAHHGNGTEEIVSQNPRIAFASVHQSPGYPGTGLHSLGNVSNFPIAPLAPRADHVQAAEQALRRLLAFRPDLLLVSAGFDAFSGDPITEMTLEGDDFATFGEWLRQSGVPTGAILEGGYSDELPRLVEAFLRSWDA